MRPVTPAFGRTITGSHRARVLAITISEPGHTGEPVGDRLPVIDGSVRLDATANVRGSLDLTVPGDMTLFLPGDSAGGGNFDLGVRTWPDQADDFLAPYGHEVWVGRGVYYNDNTAETAALGYYRIDTVSQEQPPDGPIKITGSDRMQQIIDTKLLSPRQLAATATVGSIVSALVTEVYPDAEIVWDDDTSDRTIGTAATTTEDRYGFLASLIAAWGKVWWWDGEGSLQIRSVPDPAVPLAEVMCGSDGILMGSSRSLSRIGVYNGVVASGQDATGTAAGRALAVDDDPLSPTYWSGPFGRIPLLYTSNLLITNGQARAAAAAQLARYRGLPYTLDLTLSPNPALEPWDPVAVRIGPAERRETHVIETITIPLNPAAQMTATTRQQTRILT